MAILDGVCVCVRGWLFPSFYPRFCYAAECPDSRPHRRVYHLSAPHLHYSRRRVEVQEHGHAQIAPPDRMPHSDCAT